MIHAAALRSPTVGDLDRDGNLEVARRRLPGVLIGVRPLRRTATGLPKAAQPVLLVGPEGAPREAGYYAANPALVPGDYPGPGALPNSPDFVPDIVNRKDKMNRTIWWFLAAPSLGDIDPAYPGLEIIAGNADRHLYAWQPDGTPVAGWPVILRDPAKLDERDSIDPVTHRLREDDAPDRYNGAKVIMSPAVGDIDGDGDVEVVATVNEQYLEDVNSDDAALAEILGAVGQDAGNNRV